MTAIGNQAWHETRDRVRERTELISSRCRYSTVTVTSDGRTVPWLAASGPLAYTPEKPPSRDYYFQYSWVLPGIFSSGPHQRRHFYFGAFHRDDARNLFAFWNAARAGRVDCIASRLGNSDPGAGATAPIAVYAVRDSRGRDAYLLIQHGSYQIVPAVDQPLVGDGHLVLYRGIQQSGVFRFPRLDHGQLTAAQREVWRRYMTVQAKILSNSVVSFNSIHDRAKRCETGHIHDRTWMSDDLADDHGLAVEGDGFASDLWRTTHQGFSLARWVAESKFGPNFVTCQTPLDNIRFTTFFAGEYEARIIDPGLVEFTESHRCKVERYDPPA